MNTHHADQYILFTVAETTYALPSEDVAHIEMLQEVTAYRTRRPSSMVSCFPEARSCRPSTCGLVSGLNANHRPAHASARGDSPGTQRRFAR